MKINIEYVCSQIPFNDAIKYYLHVPVSEKVTKKKMYRAECPWCNRGTLICNPLKKIVYCLECKAGGDILVAVATAEGVSPKIALRQLMDKYDLKNEPS